MRCLLWEGSEEGEKDHLLRWETVARSMEKGGLGVNLIGRNEVVGKWRWWYPKGTNSVACCIRIKYGGAANGWDALFERIKL